MQTRQTRSINATLELPAHLVEGMAAQSARMRALTFAQLVALAARIDRSRAKANAARISCADKMPGHLDQIDAQLACLWGVVEAELERRAPAPTGP